MKWISVYDRMPIAGELVVVFGSHNNQGFITLGENNGNFNGWTVCASWGDKILVEYRKDDPTPLKVKYWSILPAAPNEKE